MKANNDSITSMSNPDETDKTMTSLNTENTTVNDANATNSVSKNTSIDNNTVSNANTDTDKNDVSTVSTNTDTASTDTDKNTVNTASVNNVNSKDTATTNTDSDKDTVSTDSVNNADTKDDASNYEVRDGHLYKNGVNIGLVDVNSTGSESSADSSATTGSKTSADGSKVKGDKATFREVLKANRVFLIVFTVIMVLALVAIPLWLFKIRYIIDAPKTEVKYSITRYDHSWEKTALPDKMKDYKVNTDQYVQKDANGDNMYCIGFKPGDKDGNKAPTASHTMKAVLAFGDTKSRNFIMQNMSPISMGIKSGYINMEFCFVQTDNEYSVLAVEALAESDYIDPSHTWDVINDLMLTPTSDLNNRDERIAAIMSVLAKIGVSNEKGKTPINKDSIEQGSFYLFGYMMSETQRADYIPALFVDNTVKNNDLSIYNPDDMWKYIKALPNMSHV